MFSAHLPPGSMREERQNLANDRPHAGSGVTFTRASGCSVPSASAPEGLRRVNGKIVKNDTTVITIGTVCKKFLKIFFAVVFRQKEEQRDRGPDSERPFLPPPRRGDRR
jgi:hypothetical protein